MESVRVVLTGNRIRASGRIIAGGCGEHPAFSASYDLVTDEVGRTKRLSLRSTVASGERHASIARDEENYWLVDAGGTHVRSMFGGALDVDVVLSPFFNTLPIRRFGLAHATEDVQVPVVYVRVPDLLVQEAILTYSSGADGSTCSRRCRARPSPSTTTDSSSTIRAWPSGSDAVRSLSPASGSPRPAVPHRATVPANRGRPGGYR